MTRGNEPISPLTPEDEAVFANMRGWVRDMVEPERRAEFDDNPEFKIAVLGRIFEQNDFSDEDQQALLALGLVFGDALAASTGTYWVVADIDGDRVPMLHWAPTDMRVGAFFAFEKRVAEGLEFDVVELYVKFQSLIEQYKTSEGWD